jgi:ABC-type multidrug transport system fused ATPase/permease subunit
MANPKDNTNPFSDWSDLINQSVYSTDGKRLGLLRKISSEYMVVSGGLINLSRYFIPKSIAQSVSKKGIRLSITTYEAHTQYSYARTRNFISSLKLVKEENIEHRSFYDRFTTLRYTTSNTRNRLAGAIAFISGILFWLSGYKANLVIYQLIENEARIHAAGELLVLILFPIGILAILSQLGGITVIMGAGLFVANRVNIGKFLVIIGTGQGLFTIALRIGSEIWSGNSFLANNYIIWLTTSATGLGVLFAIISQSVSKGQGTSIYSKVFRFIQGMTTDRVGERG